MNIKKIFTLISLPILTLNYGCATIINGTTQKIPFNSNPSGATVKTSDGMECTTPCSLELKRKIDHMVTIEKTGYEPFQLNLHSVISGTVAGNILLGGLIGWGVDAGTGGEDKLVPDKVDVTLKSLNSNNDIVNKLYKLEELKKDNAISEAEYEKLKDQIIKQGQSSVETNSSSNSTQKSDK